MRRAVTVGFGAIPKPLAYARGSDRSHNREGVGFGGRLIWAAAVTLAAVWALASGQNTPAPIHFVYRPIEFRLESCETPQRHAPETMAGGVAVFDYNNDG